MLSRCSIAPTLSTMAAAAVAAAAVAVEAEVAEEEAVEAEAVEGGDGKSTTQYAEPK